MSSFEKLKAFGNDCYKRKDHSEALQYYDRALRIHSSADESEIEINKRHAIIHLNKAAVFLELKRFYEAYKEAKAAIETEGAVINVEKALYRLDMKLNSTVSKSKNYIYGLTSGIILPIS